MNYPEVDLKKAQLDQLRPLRSDSVRSLMDALQVELVYSSNAIEGNSLTLRETQVVLEQGVTIGGKPLKDHLEAVHLRDAWVKTLELARKSTPMTEIELLQLHEIVLGRDDPHAGCYRQVPVFIKGAGQIPPNPRRVPEQMADLVEACGAAEHYVVDGAAGWHHGLVYVHPFVDGNGRTARLVMNLILMRQGFPPVRIQPEERLSYYEALSAADAGAPFSEWLAGKVDRELTHWLSVLE
jgi:Fic family protein